MVRKIFTLLFSFILVFTLLIAFILFNVRYTFLNAQFYIALFNKINLYEKIYTIISSSPQGEEFAKQLQVSQEDVISLAKEIIPPSYLKENFEKFLPEFFAYLIGKQSFITFQIDTKEVKENLSSALENFVKEKIADLPPCPPAQPPQEEGFPTCIPKGQTKESFTQQFLSGLQKELAESLDMWPEKFPHKDFWQGPFVAQVSPIRAFLLTIFSFVLPILISISFFLILLITIINLRHPKTIFRTLGLTFFFADLPPLIFAFGGRIFSVLFSAIFIQGLNAPPSLKNELAKIVNIASSKLLANKMWEAIVILILAIVLFVISFFFKKKIAPTVTSPSVKPTNVHTKR